MRILMGIEDLAAGLDDLSRNREALVLLILQGERAVPVLAEVLMGPPSSIPGARCLAAEGLGAIGGEAAISALIRALTLHDMRRLDPVLRLAEEAVRNRAAG
jgi:HEAT repeat protein